MSSFNPLGSDLFGNPIKAAGLGPLAERFEFPPFSVLNAREGVWQERKRAWVGMGIKSEIGRGSGACNTSEMSRQPVGGFDNHPTAVGSLPIRVGGQFTASRKLGKTHQNVLVFAKGDVRGIWEAA